MARRGHVGWSRRAGRPGPSDEGAGARLGRTVGRGAPAQCGGPGPALRLPNRLTGDVLVVDDIVTTGATAAESVRVLQTSGARVIAVLALANA